MQKINMLGTNKASAKYAIVDDSDGTLVVFPSNNKKKAYPSSDVVLEDVEMQITENGVLHMTGNRVRYEYFGAIDGYYEYEELKKKNKYILDEKFVRRVKFLFLIPFGKPIYDGGWTELKERKPYQVSTSNYRINVD